MLRCRSTPADVACINVLSLHAALGGINLQLADNFDSRMMTFTPRPPHDRRMASEFQDRLGVETDQSESWLPLLPSALLYPVGTVLMQQGGDPGDVFYVEEGLAKLVRTGPDGREQILGLRGAGWFLGAALVLVWVRLFFVDGPRGFCQRHGKSYLTRRRRGGEGGGGGLLTGRAISSAYRWAWCRWYSRVVEVPVRIEVAAGFVAPGASEPPRLQPSWPPGGSRPAHG